MSIWWWQSLENNAAKMFFRARVYDGATRERMKRAFAITLD